MINPDIIKGKTKRTEKLTIDGFNVIANYYGEVNPELVAKSVIKISEMEEFKNLHKALL